MVVLLYLKVGVFGSVIVLEVGLWDNQSLHLMVVQNQSYHNHTLLQEMVS